MSITNILLEYDNSYESYNYFKLKIIDLTKDILKNNNIKAHSINGRIKERNSLETKIRKKNKYQKLDDVTDIIGIRIITHYENEVDIIAKIINSEFDIDDENSIDKRIKEYDRFGYSSLHFIVTLKKERACLTEYKNFKRIKIEIQIRSLLQHTWAEIEHDFGYKAKEEIPSTLKRNFSRIAALLETADIEFNNLKDANTDYSENTDQEITNKNFTIELNKVTLNSYYKSDSLLNLFDLEIASAMKSEFVEENSDVIEVNKLKFLGINTINELINIIEKEKEKVIHFTSVFMSTYTNGFTEKSSGISRRGIGLFYLSYYLALKNLSEEKFDEFLYIFWDKYDIQDNTLKNLLLESWSKI